MENGNGKMGAEVILYIREPYLILRNYHFLFKEQANTGFSYSMENEEVVQQMTEDFSDFPIDCMSNNVIDGPDTELFVKNAKLESENRYRSGFDANGKPGGEYNENYPPPGKTCGGFLKGNVGIIWKDAKLDSAAILNTTVAEDKVGFCAQCGYSLYHYSDQECRRIGKPRHPVWKGSPPPSFSDVNR